MRESDRNRLLREVRFLVLAEKDTELVDDAAALRRPVVAAAFLPVGPVETTAVLG
jgi:hypothetical protein